MKAIIIDDERDGIDVLKKILSVYAPDIECAGEAKNVEEGLKAIASHQPDIVFLDINMPGGNGFDLLKRLDTIDFEIVFVTSHEEFAIQAIKHNALDYLLKPIEVSLLMEAINKIKKRRLPSAQRRDLPIINLLYDLQGKHPEKTIPIQSNNKVKFIKLSDVVCIEAAGNYCRIVVNNRESFIHAKLLHFFEEFLKGNTVFFRVNKSHIVNLNYIREYSKGEPCILFLTNDMEVEISRRKKSEFLELIKK